MTRMILTAVVALGLIAGPALAQTPAPVHVVGFNDSGTVKPKEPDAKQLRQMYEDIAVFRTLLNRAVEKSYGVSLRVPPHHGAQGPGNIFHPFSLAEGVYLPGSGVVYNMSTPPPAQGALGTEAGSPAKEPSDWERARQELRGNKPIPSKEQAPRRPSLSESVLRLLAENGRHFKELADGEQITVAITFRGGDCMQCHAVSAGNRLSTPQRLSNLSASRQAALAALGQGAGMAPPASGGDVTVGDLHLRQGRFKDAARYFERAIQTLLGNIKPEKTQADVQRLLAAVELTNKITAALQADGDKAGAERARAMSLKYAEAAVKLAGSLKGSKVEKGTIAVPERLIVSASKKLLEQAGAGKLSFADFRKAARVQYLRFPHPEK